MSVTICVPPAFWLSLASNALRIIPSSVRSAGLDEEGLVADILIGGVACDSCPCHLFPCR